MPCSFVLQSKFNNLEIKHTFLLIKKNRWCFITRLSLLFNAIKLGFSFTQLYPKLFGIFCLLLWKLSSIISHGRMFVTIVHKSSSYPFFYLKTKFFLSIKKSTYPPVHFSNRFPVHRYPLLFLNWLTLNYSKSFPLFL